MRSLTASFDETELVREAATWAERIVRHERRWSGGTKRSAVQSAAGKYRLPESLLGRLLYPCRWPKEIGAGAYKKLELVRVQSRGRAEAPVL